MVILFEAVPSGGDYDLNACIDHFHEDDSDLAMGFAGAGKVLVDRWVYERRLDNSLLMPIIFLYRHALELEPGVDRIGRRRGWGNLELGCRSRS